MKEIFQKGMGIVMKMKDLLKKIKKNMNFSYEPIPKEFKDVIEYKRY